MSNTLPFPSFIYSFRLQFKSIFPSVFLLLDSFFTRFLVSAVLSFPSILSLPLSFTPRWRHLMEGMKEEVKRWLLPNQHLPWTVSRITFPISEPNPLDAEHKYSPSTSELASWTRRLPFELIVKRGLSYIGLKSQGSRKRWRGRHDREEETVDIKRDFFVALRDTFSQDGRRENDSEIPKRETKNIV